MFTIKTFKDGLALSVNGKALLRHSKEKPCLYLGKACEKIEMYRGNFDISDRVNERIALRFEKSENDTLYFTHPDLEGGYALSLSEKDGLLYIKGKGAKEYNRLWLRLEADKKEHVMGGGEQFSYLDLRGRLYPIWTREQGVGRNKLTEVTRLADCSDGGGGDYHTTFFPQSTFVSSEYYFVHLENYDYAELDFRAEDFHEIGVWTTSVSFVVGTGESYGEVLGKLTALLGRQPLLPDWAMRGIWFGVQGGTERALELLNKCRDGGVEIPAVWIQDWEGKRVTSFGKRLQWDWRWNKEMYPKLDEVIAKGDVRWMGYINPYLVQGGVLFNEAKEQDFFVKRPDGSDYLFDFGEFDCGIVDLTNPAAFEWYKNVIKTNLIGMGFKGWMADFGEYLPADAVCFNGETGMTAHNAWPMLWAKCNREAVEECGKTGECVFFMRAGAAGSQKYSTLTWAGDQCVDWSEDDGLPSVITAALSLGMSGFGLHTCDIGGYTTLFHLKRDRELMLRWLEFACFTPVMRTHEGNRPDSNIQLYSDDAIIAAAARLSKLHSALAPYMAACVKENSESGMPVMRPLFFREPDCDKAYGRELYSYLLGDDVLVAPVVEPDAHQRSLWLPEGKWIHLWSGKEYAGGEVTVAAALGEPPVFYEADSEYRGLFEDIRRNFGI